MLHHEIAIIANFVLFLLQLQKMKEKKGLYPDKSVYTQQVGPGCCFGALALMLRFYFEVININACCLSIKEVSLKVRLVKYSYGDWDCLFVLLQCWESQPTVTKVVLIIVSVIQTLTNEKQVGHMSTLTSCV